MHDELTARQRAISLRLAGRSVNYICAALGRVEAWFYKWWHRYLEDGPAGLYDLTRANHHVAQRIPPELERATRDSGGRHRRNTDGACGCGNCRSASRCRQVGCRWPRGG